MFGKKKIGIFGTANSGKTVLLTSLLWHLKKHRPDLFQLGKKQDVKIMDFTFESTRHHSFNFKAHCEKLIQGKNWPCKTKDFSLAKCSYHRSDCFWKQDITFVDLPGDRVSDVTIWQAEDYADWCKRMFSIWEGEPSIRVYASEFVEFCDSVTTMDDFDKLWGTLVEKCKNVLKKLYENYSPLVSPSTFRLTEKGDILMDISEETLRTRNIWDGGDFFPLPSAWKSHPDLSGIYTKM